MSIDLTLFVCVKNRQCEDYSNLICHILFLDVKKSSARLFSEKCPQKALWSVIGTWSVIGLSRSVIGPITLCHALSILSAVQ